MPRRLTAAICIVLLLLAFCPARTEGYAVLAHEAIIDSAWEHGIRPLLLARYPNATHDELRTAHGYAYGGAIIQDLGYYPHGSHEFSDMVHYIRSADFIRALLRDSQNLNDFAFALGSLAHYSADNDGHSIAVNRAVPMLYPSLRKKYGDVMTYAQNPEAHLKTEFGFDVLEVAKGRYAPDAYHDFIGFEVAKPLLQRAFEETYGIPLDSLFKDLDSSINSYRYDVSTLIPRATKVAWELKKTDIAKDDPTITRRKFLYHLSRASFNKNWGAKYEKPSFGEKFLAFVIRILPKVGPLRTLQFKTPTPQTETLFMASFNAAVDSFSRELKLIPSGEPDMPNTNFDTGGPVEPGKYSLADKAYADLLDRLKKAQFKNMPPELRANILSYYADASIPFATKKKPKEWAKVQADLNDLKAAQATAAN
jgi:Zinc dependent phospholipase C